MTIPSRLLFTAALASVAFAHDGDPKIFDRQPTYVGPGWRNAQRRPQPGGPAAVLQPPVGFVSNNVTLLSWLTIPELTGASGATTSSCFGYVSPSGREYAIMCCSPGTVFIDVTQPGNPVVVGMIPGPNSFWRDTRTYSTYAYSVSEGGSGIQVIDLANIDSGVVTLVGTVNDDATSSTHTVAVDPVSGYLYRSGGGSNGLRIYDVHTNPAAPARVGTWSNIYVHEPSIFTFTTGPAAGKQLAFCCGGLGSGSTQTGLYVVDVTNKTAPVQLAFRSYATASYSHQAWPSPDMRYLYLDDELDNLCVTRVFDIQDPQNPVFAGTFTNGNTAVDHNQYTRDDRIYQANYRSGLRVWQTSAPGTPTAPVEIASFDTWPADDLANFNGLWNNYPYLPSGIVIGSDIEKGLFVWWVGTPQATIDFVTSAPEFVDPGGEVIAVQLGGQWTGTPQMHYDVGAGFVTVDLVAGSGGVHYAVLPPAACGTTVHYYFSTSSTNGIVWHFPEGAPDTTFSAIYGADTPAVVSDSFEVNTPGWTVGPADTATAGIWVRGDPIGTALQPGDDHTVLGTNCWFTGQTGTTGAMGDGDVDGGTTTLNSPSFDLSAMSDPVFRYWRWYHDQIVFAPDDVFLVDVSNDGGATWVNVETIGPTGPDTTGGWVQHQFRVADFVAPTAQVRVRFIAADINAGGNVEAAIDDLEIAENSCTSTNVFCVGDGSSLVACPCGNSGGPGAGCANSAFATGASLSVSGVPSVASDTISLSATSVTGSIAVFFQGATQTPPTIIDDGVGCVGGPIIRLGNKATAGSASSFPQPGDPLVSVRGQVPAAGGTYYYQCFYRNAVAAFCPPATSNRTNGVRITWSP